jgi:hypothetical protein
MTALDAGFGEAAEFYPLSPLSGVDVQIINQFA